MKRRSYSMSWPALGAALAILAASIQPAGAQTSASRQSGEDFYAAGASVQVAETVAGDAVVAGGTVLVSAGVGQDLLVGAGTITITGAVGDDIRAAGGTVTITDRVGGDAILAGGTVTLGAGSSVSGNAWVAGGVLHLDGVIEGDVDSAGGEVVISGRVDGDVSVLAESVEVRSGAEIAGTLRHRGPRPAVIADDAVVGDVVYTEREFEGPEVPPGGGVLAALVAFVSIAVCTLLFRWLLPGVCREAAGNARERWVLSLGVGLLTVIVAPVLGAALFMLLVTAPLAVALLAAYAILWIGGSLVVTACLAGWLRERFLAGRGEGAGMIILSVVVAALVLWLVSLLPWVGALLVILASITGAGGLILLGARMYKQPSSP